MQGEVKISISFPLAILNHWNIEWVFEFGLINAALVKLVTYRQKCKYAEEKTRPEKNNTIDNDFWARVDFVSVTLISFKPPGTKFSAAEFTVRSLNKWLDLSEVQSTDFPLMKWKHQVPSFFQNKLIICDTFSDPMSLTCLLRNLGPFWHGFLVEKQSMTTSLECSKCFVTGSWKKKWPQTMQNFLLFMCWGE